MNSKESSALPENPCVGVGVLGPVLPGLPWHLSDLNKLLCKPLLCLVQFLGHFKPLTLSLELLQCWSFSKGHHSFIHSLIHSLIHSFIYLGKQQKTFLKELNP